MSPKGQTAREARTFVPADGSPRLVSCTLASLVVTHTLSFLSVGVTTRGYVLPAGQDYKLLYGKAEFTVLGGMFSSCLITTEAVKALF
jgi:hypothetical protein